ncbi:MAG: amidohydrolase [bacterium]
MSAADLVFTNGNGLTLDDARPEIQAVALRNGKIAAVGNNAAMKEYIGRRTEVIDLKGKTFLPGFHDAHLHFIGYGLTLQMVDLRGVNSVAEVAERVKAKASSTPPGEWIVGSGWDNNLFREGRYPTRQDLDAAAPAHPVLLTRVCGHIRAVNSRALALSGIDRNTDDPAGGKIDRDADGEPTGILRERAGFKVLQVVPPPSYDRLKDALRRAVRKAHAAGVTSVTTDDIRDDRVTVFADNLRLYRELWEAGEPAVRASLEIRDTFLNELLEHWRTAGAGGDRLKITSLKLFQDGALGARTAVLREPYTSEPESRGVPYHPQAELDELVRTGHAAGLQVAIHAIGDGAIDACLDSFERAQAAHPRRDPRHRIVHYNVVDDSILRRTRELGIIADIQPAFVALNGQWVEQHLGPERARMTYTWKTILDYGIPGAGGSDCPITPLSPLLGVWSAVTRHAYYTSDSGYFLPEERIPVLDALKLFTSGSAYADFDENTKGILAPGKLADLVVLEENPLAVLPDEIKDLRVVMTVADGKVVYTAD